MEIKKVGVVGCGFMGSGITQVVAQSGYPVNVAEVNEDTLKKGLATIDHYLTRDVERGRKTQKEKESTLGRIKGSTSIKDLSNCDLVIEVVPENIDLKKKVFAELDKVCPKNTVLTTNTSCLSIVEIGSATKRPEKVIGTHFLSPVPPSKLLEVIRSITTSDDTFDTVMKFCKSLGKEIIVAKDVPGFVFNRLLHALQLTAIRMLESGIASKEDIDKSMTLGLGHAIGPLALADFNGVDVSLFVADAMYEQTKDPLFAPPPLLKQMYAAGWFGRKTGKGFFDYPEK